MMDFKLKRWAERTGKTVCWGNIVGPWLGQEFEELFRTEEEAKERERQALAGEPIGKTREPIAVRRKTIRA